MWAEGWLRCCGAGVVISRKAVQRETREMGISGLAPGPQTSRVVIGRPAYPYLLRSVTSVYPNHIWGIDITYIRLQAGWMYLMAVDWYSRFVVSWELDQALEVPFVLHATQRALAGAAPTIWHSDQGSHFTSPQYLALLHAAEVCISMDGKGRALDNIFTERLWRTMKNEEVYLPQLRIPTRSPTRVEPLPLVLQPRAPAPNPGLSHARQGLPRSARERSPRGTLPSRERCVASLITPKSVVLTTGTALLG